MKFHDLKNIKSALVSDDYHNACHVLAEIIRAAPEVLAEDWSWEEDERGALIVSTDEGPVWAIVEGGGDPDLYDYDDYLAALNVVES